MFHDNPDQISKFDEAFKIFKSLRPDFQDLKLFLPWHLKIREDSDTVIEREIPTEYKEEMRGLQMSSTCDETKCNGDCASCGGDGVTVTLTLDDDSTIECGIVGIFDADNKEYIALLPLDEDGKNSDGEVFLYRYKVDAAGTPQLENIESDEEYEAASDAFDELLDSMEYDELVSEEELN